MMYGLDTLAAAKYPKRAAKFALPAAGIFWRTFGNSRRAINEMAEKCDVIRVQGIWRDDHNFSKAKWKRRAGAIAVKVQKIANRNPDCRFYYSPFCEHNLSTNKMREVLEYVQACAPALELVNTPSPSGDLVPGYINEVHATGDSRRPEGRYFFSFDGMDALDAPMNWYKERHKRAEVFFLWTPLFNLKRSVHDQTPRWARTARPGKRIFRAIRRYACVRKR